MEKKERQDVGLRTVWSFDVGSPDDEVTYTFHDAVSTDFWEEYNEKKKEVCLWFCLSALAVTRSNGHQEKALKELLE